LHGSNSHARNDEGHFVRLEVELEKLKYYQTHGLWETYYKVIRNNFLDMFYINTIHIIFTKFDEIPIERIHVMQVIVRKFFPDYLEYYKEAGMNVYIVLTVAFDLPLEKWKELKDAYHDARVYGAYRLAGWINDMETALNL
jgi:hypothetical protein